MRPTSLFALALAGSCTPNVPEKKPPHGEVVDLLHLPSGTPVVVETLGDAGTASPEALRQYLMSKATIEGREAINDGFVATFVDGTTREAHIVREAHHRWYRCHAVVTDDAMRDAVIALCKSTKL